MIIFYYSFSADYLIYIRDCNCYLNKTYKYMLFFSTIYFAICDILENLKLMRRSSYNWKSLVQTKAMYYLKFFFYRSSAQVISFG